MFWHRKKKKAKDTIQEIKEKRKELPSAFERINIWQKEQFLKEFNDKERKYFLELAQKELLQGVPPCQDLYFYCFFSTLKFRFLSQAGHDARFSYVYAWGSKDLNDQIALYEKKISRFKK